MALIGVKSQHSASQLPLRRKRLRSQLFPSCPLYRLYSIQRALIFKEITTLPAVTPKFQTTSVCFLCSLPPWVMGEKMIGPGLRSSQAQYNLSSVFGSYNFWGKVEAKEIELKTSFKKNK